MSLVLQLACEFMIASQEFKIRCCRSSPWLIVSIGIRFCGVGVDGLCVWRGVCGFKVRAFFHALNEVQQAMAAHLGQPWAHFVPSGGIHGAEDGQALGHAFKVLVVTKAVNGIQPLLLGLIGQQLIACGPGNVGVDLKLPVVF